MTGNSKTPKVREEHEEHDVPSPPAMARAWAAVVSAVLSRPGKSLPMPTGGPEGYRLTLWFLREAMVLAPPIIAALGLLGLGAIVVKLMHP